MERQELEKLVDDMFERSDKRLFEIMHEIARHALQQAMEKENEGLSQIPPVPVHSSGSILVTPSSSL
jgi:lauroyl/myristoyl acyltransferase